MAFRRPLVIVDGVKSELPIGDQIASNTYAPAGGGASGIATVNFGAGKGLASVDVVGQTGITAETPVFVQIALRYTDSGSPNGHTPDEAMIEQLDVRASSPSSDTGFTIYIVSRYGMLFGQYDVSWNWR